MWQLPASLYLLIAGATWRVLQDATGDLPSWLAPFVGGGSATLAAVGALFLAERIVTSTSAQKRVDDLKGQHALEMAALQTAFTQALAIKDVSLQQIAQFASEWQAISNRQITNNEDFRQKTDEMLRLLARLAGQQTEKVS